jgi:hypothetical protein
MHKRCGAFVIMGIAVMAGAVRAADDAEAIADRYVAAMERKGYSFLTKEELARRHEVVAADVAKWQHAPLGEAERAAVLEGVDRCIDRLYTGKAGARSAGNGFGSGDEEWMYLNDRDFFQTFRYHLWAGLSQAPLTPEEQKRRDAQREWMRSYLKNLPGRGPQEVPPRAGMTASEVRPWALAELEKDFADPLHPLHEALPEAGFSKLQERFKSFSNGIAADLHDMEVAGLTARFVDHADAAARYGRTYTGKLPFDDAVVDLWGNGPMLCFESNALFRGSHANVAAGSVYDVVRCDGIGGTDRTFAGAEAFATKEGRGDVTLADDALVGLRGAKLALLPVKSWFDADDWTTEELRGAIKDAGKERLSVKGVPSMNGRHKADRSQGEFFAVVQTKEGRIAVIYVSGYEFGVGLWCRARAAE